MNQPNEANKAKIADMHNTQQKRIIISLGGSIIVPDEIDSKFIKNFRNVIMEFVKKGFCLVIVTGGGATARQYQRGLRGINGCLKSDLDWIGIYSTRLNAQLLKLLFKNVYQEVIIDPEKVNNKIKNKIIMAAGWKPGWSTDYVAIKLAVKFRAKTVINLSNIDFIYNKDPNKFKNARPIREIKWPEFKKLVGGQWLPGANLPFDPIASKLAEKQKIQVIVMNGRKLINLKNFLQGKKFIGTVIN
jgi:uridylate kinase